MEIIDSRITPDRETELWHIRDDGTEEKIENITVEEGRIVFEAAGFSVYVVVVHEDGTVANPRVEFHFISRDDNALTGGNRVYYASAPYPFRNKDGQNQTTQILKDGEALELITDNTTTIVNLRGGDDGVHNAVFSSEDFSYSFTAGTFIPDDVKAQEMVLQVINNNEDFGTLEV